MSNLRARLNKSEKKQYKELIKDSLANKIISLKTAGDVKFAWHRLCYDHYTRLCSDLNHIGKIPVIDELEADCLDGETLFNTKCFFKHYKDSELDLMKSSLWLAKNGIAYLEKLIDAERESRKK